MKSKELLLKHLSLNDCKGYVTSDGRLYKAIIDALEEAINYTRCSTQLKDKYGKDFEYFVTNKVNVRNVGNIYWFKGIGYTDLDELYKKWLKITKPLIV